MLMVAMDITLFSQNKEICLFMKIYPQKNFWTLDPRKFILQIFFVFPFLLYFYSFFFSSDNWPFYVHFNWTEILNGFYSINTCKALVTPCLARLYDPVLCVATQLRAHVLTWLRAYVLACLACLRAWRVCVLGVLMCLTCLHARMLGVLLYSRALLTCFLWCVLGVLDIGVLTFLSDYSFCLHKSRLYN